MANPQHWDIAKVDLNSGTVFRSFLHKAIVYGDKQSNVFGVELYRGKEAVYSNGTCYGFFIRPDRNTVIIKGTIDGNTAYVSLPGEAYAYTGSFSLVIKITGYGYEDAMRIVDGTIIESGAGGTVDPGSLVPSVEDLMEAVEAAEAAVGEIETLEITATQVAQNHYGITVSYGEEE